jgi:hypothetical protein
MEETFRIPPRPRRTMSGSSSRVSMTSETMFTCIISRYIPGEPFRESSVEPETGIVDQDIDLNAHLLQCLHQHASGPDGSDRSHGTTVTSQSYFERNSAARALKPVFPPCRQYQCGAK